MNYFSLLLISIWFVIASVNPVLAGEIRVTYLYNLSDFDGTIPYNAVRTFVDENRSEVYVVTSGGIDIYNSSGMQIYHFDFDREFGGVVDAAVNDRGDILLLNYFEGRYRIVHCNYRGDPRYSVELGKFPQEFEDFRPGRLILQDGKLYLISQSQMKVAVIDNEGLFLKGYDLAVLFNLTDKQREDTGTAGFSLDGRGRMLFTIPALGRAFVCEQDGVITEFGKRGSGPGKFGVPSGIAADRDGNLLVTDKLRSVIMIFNNKLEYIKEFGYRGFRPGNVVVPSEITVDHKTNRVYVSQMRRRGVNIYQLIYEE